MDISSVSPLMNALASSLSQLQDTFAISAGALQQDSAVTAQGVLAAAQTVPVPTTPVLSYNPTGDYSAGAQLGNALNIAI